MPVRLSCFRFIGFANFVESQPQPVNCLFSVFNIRREPDGIARETASAIRKAASICRDCDSGFRDVNSISRETDSIVRTADSIRSDRDSIAREPDSVVRDLATGQNSTVSGIREAESGNFLKKRPILRDLTQRRRGAKVLHELHELPRMTAKHDGRPSFGCAEGATEISPVLVRWRPCASTYAGKSSHKNNSFSASDGEKVAGGRMR